VMPRPARASDPIASPTVARREMALNITVSPSKHQWPKRRNNVPRCACAEHRPEVSAGEPPA
jgi:hypothetical protein